METVAYRTGTIHTGLNRLVRPTCDWVRRPPRNQNDQMGPYEASLVGNPIAEPEKPLEVKESVFST